MMSETNLTLHEAMRTVLAELPDHAASTQVLAEEIARRGLYRQKRGGPAPSGQIRIRAVNYAHLFELVDRRTVRLIQPPG